MIQTFYLCTYHSKFLVIFSLEHNSHRQPDSCPFDTQRIHSGKLLDKINNRHKLFSESFNCFARPIGIMEDF